MKILQTLCCALLITATAATAQPTSEAPVKEVVLIDFFSRIREVPAPYTEVLRKHVLDAFADRGRHTLIDAESSRMLAASAPGTGITSLEMAAADMNSYLNARASQAIDAGARYLVSGTIVGYKFEHVQLPSGDRNKPPQQGFKASLRVILSGLDLKLGERMRDDAFELTATAPVPGDADMAALAHIRGSLEFYIDRNFKFETRILELCPPDRKGRLKELYIHSGSYMGVKPGDLFMVYEEVPIGGVMTRQKVGRLRVHDVGNPDVARCKVTKGDDEIGRAFTAGRTLICISDGQSFF